MLTLELVNINMSLYFLFLIFLKFFAIAIFFKVGERLKGEVYAHCFYLHTYCLMSFLMFQKAANCSFLQQNENHLVSLHLVPYVAALLLILQFALKLSLLKSIA